MRILRHGGAAAAFQEVEVGAGIGAVAGAAAGELLGYYGTSRDRCVYERADGTRYIDTCPRG